MTKLLATIKVTVEWEVDPDFYPDASTPRELRDEVAQEIEGDPIGFIVDSEIEKLADTMEVEVVEVRVVGTDE